MRGPFRRGGLWPPAFIPSRRFLAGGHRPPLQIAMKYHRVCPSPQRQWDRPQPHPSRLRRATFPLERGRLALRGTGGFAAGTHVGQGLCPCLMHHIQAHAKSLPPSRGKVASAKRMTDEGARQVFASYRKNSIPAPPPHPPPAGAPSPRRAEGLPLRRDGGAHWEILCRGRALSLPLLSRFIPLRG